MTRTRLAAPLLALCIALLAGCADAPKHPCEIAPTIGDSVAVVDQGWHTEIGLQADRLAGPLAIFRTIYPGARTIMFGYGKRTFMTAPPDSLGEYLLGPFPGPGVLETVGLRTGPEQAYGAAATLRLALPPGGDAALSRFVWSAFARSRDGSPRLVGPGSYKGALFYDARDGYSLGHTCNTWIAEALHAAGLPVDPYGVIFSGQVMRRAANAASGQCRAEQR